MHARFGRWLAWRADAEAAEDSFRRPIEAATRAGFPGDVARALTSISDLHHRYGPLDEEALESQRLSGAIEGSRKIFEGRRDALRGGLQSWRYGNLPDAHLALRRHLWECRLGGHFGAEFEAHRLIGELYAAAGMPVVATRHLVRGGDAKQAAPVAAQLPEPTDMVAELAHPAPWVLAAALTVIKAQADVIVDDQIPALVVELFRAARGVVDFV